MDVILIDTSAYFATVDKTDKNHHRAISFLKSNQLPLVTSNLIAVEAINLVNSRIGHQQAILLGKKLYDKNLTTIINITPEDERKAWQIFQKYIDKDFSLTDCISFALMERLNIKKAFAFDIHFFQYGKFSIYP